MLTNFEPFPVILHLDQCSYKRHKIMKIYNWIVLLLVLSMPAMADNFDKGWAAYSASNYEASIAIWEPLANEGNAVAQLT